jgi:arylsulfatase A-like enzyme
LAADRSRLALAACLLLACAGAESPPTGNVLILLADDLGTNKVGAYREELQLPSTPNIDALAARGVLFRNAYAAPLCSPSRAALLTGRYPRRYGFGSIVHASRDDFELPLEEQTLPEVVAGSPAGYATSAVGKWHLASRAGPSGLRHPLLSGFGWYAGSFGNLRSATPGSGKGRGYLFWEKDDNGRVFMTRRYATTDTVDDALARIEAMPEPWLLYVAFNAAHSPWDEPPVALHPVPVLETPADRFDAVAEALDREIGRLLEGLGPERLARTTVIFAADNGTPVAAQRLGEASRQHKGTLFEGGIHVPLIVAGPPVARPGSECGALVHLVDVFPTVVELVGLDPGALSDVAGRPLRLDGRSLLPQLADPSLPSPRAFVFQDRFRPNGPGPYEIEERMLRDVRYKLMETPGRPTRFYDLAGRREEGENLMGALSPEQQRAYERLHRAMAEIVAELDSDLARAG